MKCPSCELADLIHDSRVQPYAHKGESTVIPNVRGGFCPSCGEVLTDADESKRTIALMLDFKKQVYASILDPNFTTQI